MPQSAATADCIHRQGRSRKRHTRHRRQRTRAANESDGRILEQSRVIVGELLLRLFTRLDPFGEKRSGPFLEHRRRRFLVGLHRTAEKVSRTVLRRRIADLRKDFCRHVDRLRQPYAFEVVLIVSLVKSAQNVFLALLVCGHDRIHDRHIAERRLSRTEFASELRFLLSLQRAENAQILHFLERNAIGSCLPSEVLHFGRRHDVGLAVVALELHFLRQVVPLVVHLRELDAVIRCGLPEVLDFIRRDLVRFPVISPERERLFDRLLLSDLLDRDSVTLRRFEK